VLLLLVLGACDTSPRIVDVNAACVPDQYFDDLLVFVATTSGEVDDVSIRVVIDDEEWSQLPLAEEVAGAWTGEMWGSTARLDCDSLEDVLYRFVATGPGDQTDTVDLDAETTTEL